MTKKRVVEEDGDVAVVMEEISMLQRGGETRLRG